MKINKNVILGLLILSLSVGLFGQQGYSSQNEFEPEIIDARAEALGRTSILSSTGANYLFNNPAMLGDLNRMNIQISGRTTKLKGISNFKIENGDEIFEIEHENKNPFHYKLIGVSLGIPYTLSADKNLKMGFGVGYRTYYDWGINIHYESKNSNYEYNKKFHGGFNTLVLGCGFNYQKKFFGGFSMSFPLLSNISSVHDYENGVYYEEDYETEGTMKGTFLTFSGSYILNQKITLGARLRSGFILELENKFEFESNEEWEYNTKISIPSEIGLAIEIKPITNLKLYLEYLSRGFSDYKVDPLYQNIYYNEDSDNGFSLRTGFEVGKDYLFRCGFFTQSLPVYERKSYYDPVEDLYLGMMDDKPQIEMGLTTGFGLKINSIFSLDIYSTYSFLNYNEHQQLGEDYYISGDYSSSKIKIGCTMGCNF